MAAQARAAKVERTQATYYTSALYPVPLTPEYISDTKPNRMPKNGQVAWPLNHWTAMDAWYMTNNWYHRTGDRVPFRIFCGYASGLHNHEPYDQPYIGHLNYSTRTYDDNIIGQTIGAAAIGLQLGFGFGILHTANLAKEANIFQSMSMPPNRWLPKHKAGPQFRMRIMGSCMIQCSTFLGAYALVDGCSSQLRHKDDIWNPILGGLASGGVLYAWFRNAFMTIPLGFIFGYYMGLWRFGALPDGHPKPAFDLERPFWGIFGGIPSWLAGEEPVPDRWFWQFWDSKYRSGN